MSLPPATDGRPTDQAPAGAGPPGTGRAPAGAARSRPTSPRPTGMTERRASALGFELVTLAVATSWMLAAVGLLGARQNGYPALLGVAAGFVAGGLAVLALPSVPTRLSTLACVAASGLLMVRFVGKGAVDVVLVAMWGAGVVAVLVLTQRIAPDGGRSPSSPPDRSASGATRPRRGWLAASARLFVLAGAAVAVLAVLLAPLFSRGASAGQRSGSFDPAGVASSSPSLRASDSLDTTTRPQLDDTLLMTIQADRPAYWRGEVFDRWNGRTWTRTDGSTRRVIDPGGDRLPPDPLDPDPAGGQLLRQHVRIESSFSDVVFAAPEPESVDVPTTAFERADGTLFSIGMGKGATYTVTSRQLPVTRADLARASGAVPESVRSRYGAAPVTTDRVRELADRLTAGASTTLEKVQAVEAWMGSHTTYSIDAPLAPAGVDVVDHFLFVSHQGWCEQIASSEVVLLRAAGVPARLATGFVPDEVDPVSGAYQVRAKDAHAWTEVWFPGVGWQDFDPTASVPLAGESHAPGSILGWLRDHVALVLVAAGLVVVAVAAWPGLRRRRSRRGGTRRRPSRRSWAGTQLARLEVIGLARADRRRPASETAGRYAAAVAGRLRDERLPGVGTAIDASLYGGPLPSAAERAAVERTLADLRPPVLARWRAGWERRRGHR